MEVIENTSINADVLDLRTLAPLDTEAIFESVRKTGKALVLTEDNITGSVASDIAAMIGEECFEQLDAPVKRLGSIDTPIPFEKGLEDNYLPKNVLEQTLKDLLNY